MGVRARVRRTGRVREMGLERIASTLIKGACASFARRRATSVLPQPAHVRRAACGVSREVRVRRG